MLESGYYYCELRAFFSKGTYVRKCFYEASTNRYLYDGNADVTRRVIRVIEKVKTNE